jgi:hypothetical protein
MSSLLAQSIALFVLALHSSAPVNAQFSFSMDFPTVSPSGTPSMMPDDGYCRPEDVMGKVFYGYLIGKCFKFDVSPGGQIIADDNDPNCAVRSGTGTVFSTFGGFTGKTLNWNAAPVSVFSGTLDFLENPSRLEPFLVLNAFEPSTGVFDITLELPACNPSFCRADQIIGNTFHAPLIGNCFQIEAVPGGSIYGDNTDPSCANKSGAGPQFSLFDGFFDINRAYFSPGQAGFDGYMDFVRDPTLSAPQLINNGMYQAKTFNVTLALPECPM